MLLIPYKADVDLGRLPIMTLAVCAICIWVFARQALSDYAYRGALAQYCTYEIKREEQLALRYLAEPRQHYCEVLLEIRAAPDREAAIRELADTSRPASFYRDSAASRDFIYSTLKESSRRFESTVPLSLTERLHYDPSHPTVVSMVTAAFSHGSWWHLISNLIFFFAFAASVEVIAGYGYYLLFIVLSAVGTHLAYFYSVQDAAGAPPTVGLSGVVMATMAFLATVAPSLGIRVFFWFLVFVRTFRVPALAIAALYIAQNVFDYMNLDPDSNVNYVAHISGAVIGIACGVLYRIRHREFLRQILHGI